MHHQRKEGRGGKERNEGTGSEEAKRKGKAEKMRELRESASEKSARDITKYETYTGAFLRNRYSCDVL